MLYWIKDKMTFVSSDDLGTDLEHVEVMQRKFDEFLKELDHNQVRITDINLDAQKLIDEGHPEVIFICQKHTYFRIKMNVAKSKKFYSEKWP